MRGQLIADRTGRGHPPEMAYAAPFPHRDVGSGFKSLMPGTKKCHRRQRAPARQSYPSLVNGMWSDRDLEAPFLCLTPN
jgi:hypothetical protein